MKISASTRRFRHGRKLEWGKVKVFESSAHFAMRWWLGHPVEQGTDVSVQFEPLSQSSCRLNLTHKNWERPDAEGARMRNSFDGGRVTVFEQRLENYAGRA